MKPVYVFSLMLIYCFSLISCSYSKNKESNLRYLTETDTDNGNVTALFPDEQSSSGLSAGAICAIAIPCIAALVGVAAAAAILGGGSAAAAPALASVPYSLPPAQFIDTSVAKLGVVQEIPPTQVIQPQVIPQQPVIAPEPVIQPIVQPPVQPVVAQPQMAPVQQMQLVPVQQVEMVPVQQVEMVPVQEVVPVQEIVPTYQQAVETVPQITQVSEVPQVTQVTQVQGIEGAQQGIQGGEFLTAPEGYGTSVIQGNQGGLEFSTNNLI